MPFLLLQNEQADQPQATATFPSQSLVMRGWSFTRVRKVIRMSGSGSGLASALHTTRYACMNEQLRRRRSCSRFSRAIETVESRELLSAVSVSIDGSGHNTENPDWGQAHIELLRLTSPAYADGISAPSGQDRPNPRLISNQIANQTQSLPNARGLTDYAWMWGQFLDHDITLSESANPAEAFPVPIPSGEPLFDPFGTGRMQIPLNRSIYNTEAPDDAPRQQINEVTAFLDGSAVYGSDAELALRLRTLQGGLLKTSAGNLLPLDDGPRPPSAPPGPMFLAGDVRASENPGLAAIHTLLVREHNRLATQLAAENPELNDEQLYQAARRLVIATQQAITWNEFLPALLGPGALRSYAGYNPHVNPGVANEFSAAAFRLGHSLLTTELQRLDADGNVIAAGNLSLQQAFFNVDDVIQHGIDPILRGAATQRAQELDTKIVSDVRNFLFGPPGAGGMDLVSLNIQRGRDHGLADYNSIRQQLGLTAITQFSDITTDADLATALEETYGSVDKIDLWVGGLSEDHLPGSSLGETFNHILVDQFERMRDGDSNWYQNVFSGEQLQQLEATTLKDIIERNTQVRNLPANVFFQAGAEVLFVSTAALGTDSLRIRQTGDLVEVIDVRRQRVIVSRPVSEVAEVVIRGRENVRERFVVQIPEQTAAALSVRIDGGVGNTDTLVVEGTSGDDNIVVDAHTIHTPTLDMVFEGIHSLIMNGNDGDDVLDCSASTVTEAILHGGSGNDLLIGSSENDRLYGGDGADVLKGGTGDDFLSGGAGNDRLYGNDGLDQLNGGSGNDLLSQDGDGHQTQDMPRLAIFLQEEFGIRSTGNDFLNWGGLGEKWMWSRTGWLFFTPDGTLYRWDRSSTATGDVVANLGPEIFTNIHLLVMPGNPDIVDDDSASLMMLTAQQLRLQMSLRLTGNLFENWAGLGERWMWGSGGWFFITPDGMLYSYDPRATGIPGDLVMELGSQFFQVPALLAGSSTL